MHKPGWLKSIPEIWTSLEQFPLQTPSRDFHRRCHILPLSSFFWRDTIASVFSGQVAVSFWKARNTYETYVRIGFSPQASLDFIALFNDSRAFIFNSGTHSTLWCQQPPIQIMKSVCETVTDECTPKLGSDVDCYAPDQTEGAFSHWPELSHLEETPGMGLSCKCLSIN